MDLVWDVETKSGMDNAQVKIKRVRLCLVSKVQSLIIVIVSLKARLDVVALSQGLMRLFV
jgi:hypothetical protein